METVPVSGFVVIPKDDFNMDAYTEIGIRVADAAALDCYGDDYEKLIDSVVSDVEAIAG